MCNQGPCSRVSAMQKSAIGEKPMKAASPREIVLKRQNGFAFNTPLPPPLRGRQRPLWMTSALRRERGSLAQRDVV